VGVVNNCDFLLIGSLEDFCDSVPDEIAGMYCFDFRSLRLFERKIVTI
jgi:hypothetical protein